MSSIALSGNAAGAGVFTIAAPNSASSFTATLPAATTTLVGTDATQTLTNKTLTSPTLTTPVINSATFATVSGTAPLYAARAWVNFNGTGTVAIRDSGNVSSITDNGTGDYTVNFTTAMSDANYAANISVSRSGDNTNIPVRQFVTYAVGSLRFLTGDNTAGSDMNFVNVAIFR
jgi:hypothetical protein